MNSIKNLFKKDGMSSVISSLISILIGLVAGAIVVIIVGLLTSSISGTDIWDGIRLVVAGIFNTGRDASGALTFGFNPINIGNLLFRATPLILTGLSVAVAFKTGLFNIGAAGQYLAGTAATLYLALSIPTDVVPAAIVWIIAFLGGILAGALWGAIPGILKAFLNMNEVIACIMTNWIAANLVTWVFDIGNLKNAEEAGKVAYIFKTTHNNVATPKFGLDAIFPNSQVNGGIIIAILIAILIYILLNKTTIGFEMKACGSNRHAARYAGINDKKNIVLSMAIAGGLAGAAASLYYLSGNTEFYWSTYQSLPADAFNGIPVALLAVSNPIGTVFSGMFMSMLNISGQQLKGLTSYNEYITDIVIAVIVYLSAFSLVIKLWISKKKKKANEDKERKARMGDVIVEPSVATKADVEVVIPETVGVIDQTVANTEIVGEGTGSIVGNKAGEEAVFTVAKDAEIVAGEVVNPVNTGENTSTDPDYLKENNEKEDK